MTNALCRCLIAAISVPVSILIGVKPASAKVLSSKSYQYFYVNGKTVGELDRDLAVNGPKLSGGRKGHAGLTKIKFGYEVSYQESEHRCSLAKAKVTLSTKIILPKWRYRSSANSKLRFIWDTLYADVKRHEERHAEIARQYAKSMDDALSSLSPSRTCKELEKRAQRIVTKQNEAHDRDQERFDRVESRRFDARMIRLLKNRSAHISQ